MATGSGNLLLDTFSGGIGKQIVVKRYVNKIVLAAYPRKYKRTLTPLKDIYESRFKEAIKYARSIIRNNDLKKQYECRLKPGQRLYNYLISEYLLEEKRKSSGSAQSDPNNAVGL